jgi:hypothetical protein
MAVAKWATPSARGSNIASTNLNSLANGSESTAVTYDNSTARDLYGIITIKLGSITPATVALSRSESPSTMEPTPPTVQRATSTSPN